MLLLAFVFAENNKNGVAQSVLCRLGILVYEWHYYISSRRLSPIELLHHARMEWSVETMHFLLDVHFEEDWCRVEDKSLQENLNIFRKAAINFIKQFKTATGSKQSISGIMLDCLIDSRKILLVIGEN